MNTKRQAARFLLGMVALAVIGGLVFGVVTLRAADRRATRAEARVAVLEQRVLGDESTLAKRLSQLQGDVGALQVDPTQITPVQLDNKLAQLEQRVSFDETNAGIGTSRLDCLANAVDNNSATYHASC